MTDVEVMLALSCMSVLDFKAFLADWRRVFCGGEKGDFRVLIRGKRKEGRKEEINHS